MINSLSNTLKSRLLYGRVLGSAMAAGTMAMAIPAYAQQTGAINGQVMGPDGSGIAGVTITASSPVLPTARQTTSDSTGFYQLPSLVPGTYTLTFTRPSGETMTQDVPVLLQQRLRIDATFGGDELIVTGQKIVIDTGQASLKETLGADIVDAVPTGQNYRDLMKLIPGVQYTNDATRGPSAGGNGQDNIYLFDGVDVSLPLFGTLPSEPASQDIDQVSIVRGGAKAIGFNRSGGFLMNSTSKRGTDEWHGELGYQFQTSGMASKYKQRASEVKDKRSYSWVTANIGGPIWKDNLYFYGSYYRPEVKETDRVNLREELPDKTSVRNEYFGKLTFAPTDQLLLDVSYRHSDRKNRNDNIGPYDAASTAVSDNQKMDIITAEGSFIIDDSSNIGFKFTDFKSDGSLSPDNLLDISPNLGDPLPLNNLASIGQFSVPSAMTPDPAYNAFAQQFVDQYGFMLDGQQVGAGAVGVGFQIDDTIYKRRNFEVSYDKSFSFDVARNDFHIGYQFQDISELLRRESNGYGSITVLGGQQTAADGVTPAYLRARVYQMGLANYSAVGDGIKSSSKLQSIEINDTIELEKWTFDVGVMFSNDTLYGQGLRENRNNFSGFELAPGNKYKMYEVNWNEMIQPRLGVRYDWTDRDSLYANFAKYNPPASSLARAASWDRNNSGARIDAYYDINGNFIDSEQVQGSSGKPFAAGLKPRFVDEYLVGWDHWFSDAFKGSISYRHRDAGNFWEDTPNDSRLNTNSPAGYGAAPEHIRALGLYIPELSRIQQELNTGSSYVIAQLDDAYTDYDEVNLQGEFQRDNWYINGSYTWSKYQGNFDQDNTTANNDQSIFIGSSNIADGRGRQVWDFKDGTLRGDRTHVFKAFGYYDLPWNGQIGAFSVYQSGQPWETWDGSIYGFSSDTIRYSEPAGSHRSDSHFQLDLNYTQNFTIFDTRNIQIRADLYNVFNSRTGYDIDPYIDGGPDFFGKPRKFYDPRRLQLSFKAQF